MAQSEGSARKSREATIIRIQVDAVARDGGDYDFRFSGADVVAPNGDLDFSKIPTPIELFFVIADRSEKGLRFARPAESAIAIILERDAEPGVCPSSRPTKKGQFFGFRLSRDRRTLRVLNHNSDQQHYRYALNFNNAKGCAVVLDPKLINDSSGGFEE